MKMNDKKTGMFELRYTIWDGTDQVYRLSEGRTRLGRTSQNDLQIDELTISDQHCEFEVKEGKVFVRDVGSFSGTFLDGKLIEEAEVHSGQVLNLGSFSIHISSIATYSKRDEKRKDDIMLPQLLSDGTYSCQMHLNQRANFECKTCYTLFCEACFSRTGQHLEEVSCPKCNKILHHIDWSKMHVKKGDVMKELLPKGMKKALDYWTKFRSQKEK